MSDFMNRETLRAALTEQLRKINHSDTLHFEKREEFLVETAFLRYWDREQGNIPSQEGIVIDADAFSEDGQPFVQFTIWCEQLGETVQFIYADIPGWPGQHDLTIIQDDCVVYRREASQDPRTEWLINCMAGDDTVTDADGKMLFVGETTNI